MNEHDTQLGTPCRMKTAISLHVTPCSSVKRSTNVFETLLNYFFACEAGSSSCLCLFSTYALQPSRLIVRSGLDVPTFATRHLHVCHHARAPSGGR
jgi:hypothetical protein